jgi:hypothetical protein
MTPLWLLQGFDLPCDSLTPRATMDILTSRAYLCRMIARLITLLAVVAITVVTTVSSAHAARMGMSSGLDHAMHVGEMMHSADIVERACDGERRCGSAEAGICETVCAGFAVVLTAPSGKAGHPCAPASPEFPPETCHVSRAQDLNERPPKLCLL